MNHLPFSVVILEEDLLFAIAFAVALSPSHPPLCLSFFKILVQQP